MSHKWWRPFHTPNELSFIQKFTIISLTLLNLWTSFSICTNTMSDNADFKSILIEVSFILSDLNIVSRWHRRRPRREPYRISRMENVQCRFNHWMLIHFNAFQMAIEGELMGDGNTPLTMGKYFGAPVATT